MKTFSNISKKNTDTFTGLVVVFVMILGFAFSNKVSAQDGIPVENTTAVANAEYQVSVNYDLLADEKNALSPEYQVVLSSDGDYYIMTSQHGNVTNYKVGYIGKLSAPKISSSSIIIEHNTEMAFDNNNPVNNDAPLIAMQ